MSDSTSQRVLLDLQFTPDDPTLFALDDVIAALEGAGTIGEVKVLWMGAADGPIGNVPWPRIPPPEEQVQIDAALAQIAEEDAAPPVDALSPPPDVDPDVIDVGVAEGTEQVGVPLDVATAGPVSPPIAPVAKRTKRARKS